MGGSEEEAVEAAGAAMFGRDRAARGLGMRLEEIRPGYGRVRMTVRADMLNGHGTCHGGIVFALADTAFACACNSRGVLTVAAGCSIEYLAPAREGDELVAEAAERSLQGRQGVYDVDVHGSEGTLVATFRGRSTAPRGPASGAGS